MPRQQEEKGGEGRVQRGLLHTRGAGVTGDPEHEGATLHKARAPGCWRGVGGSEDFCTIPVAGRQGKGSVGCAALRDPGRKPGCRAARGFKGF